MNVRMRLQGLSPAMQDAEEADLRPEMFGIGGQFQQGGRGGLEQEREEDLLVLPHQGDQGVRHTEDQMKIVDRQQLLLTFSEPLLASVSLAFRTMAISAGVVGDASAVSAMGTVVEMAAQRGGAATGNGQEHFDLRPSQGGSIAFPEATPGDADDVGHLPGWPGHPGCSSDSWLWGGSANCSRGLVAACRWRCERC